jgi:FkbM family methyltransferase
MRKIFIDGGANKGQSTKSFIERYSEFNFDDTWSSEDWEIYMIEPQTGCSELINETKSKYDKHNIDFLLNAIWINNDDIQISSNAKCTESASVVYKKWKNQSVKGLHLSEWIRTNFDKDDYIFLKLDIEGAEYDVIEDLYKTGTLSYINEIHGELHGIKKGYNINDDLKLIERLKKYDLKLWSWNGSNMEKPIRGNYYRVEGRKSAFERWEKMDRWDLKPDFKPLEKYENNYEEWYSENMG